MRTWKHGTHSWRISYLSYSPPPVIFRRARKLRTLSAHYRPETPDLFTSFCTGDSNVESAKSKMIFENMHLRPKARQDTVDWVYAYNVIGSRYICIAIANSTGTEHSFLEFFSFLLPALFSLSFFPSSFYLLLFSSHLIYRVLPLHTCISPLSSLSVYH